MLKKVVLSLLIILYLVIHLRISKTSLQQFQCPRQYHHCVDSQIPYISQPLETAFYLLHSNSSFVRFGDSEVLLMLGGSEPFQTFNQSLSDALRTAFHDPDPRILIGIYDVFSGFPLWKQSFTNWWLDTQRNYRTFVLEHGWMRKHYFSAMITSTYIHTYGTHCALLSELYDTLRNIWRNKDVIIVRGDNKQVFDYDIYDTARSQTIYLAPRYHAWNAFQSLQETLMREDCRRLFILTAGPVSRVLAYHLSKAGRRALDLGHLAKDYDSYMKGIHPDDDSFFERNEIPQDQDSVDV